MSNLTADIRFDGEREEIIRYAISGGITPTENNGSSEIEPFTSGYLPTMGREISEELEKVYRSLYVTGKVEKVVISAQKRIVEIVESSIGLLNEVLEVYDDEIERMNTFSLFEDKIKSLWELRKETNQNFVDVIVLLEVAFKNSHYKSYQKNQYQSIKQVLKKIKTIYVTPQQVKECRQLLIDNGIDLFAPIRNWDDYTIEIKKNIETK